MGVAGDVRGQLAASFEVLLPHLNERQQRLALASEARLLGHGGLRAVADAAGVSQATVGKGAVDSNAVRIRCRSVGSVGQAGDVSEPASKTLSCCRPC
jgi:hypothetical protein